MDVFLLLFVIDRSEIICLMTLEGRRGRGLSAASARLSPSLTADRGLIHRLEWVITWHASVVKISLTIVAHL